MNHYDPLACKNLLPFMLNETLSFIGEPLQRADARAEQSRGIRVHILPHQRRRVHPQNGTAGLAISMHSMQCSVNLAICMQYLSCHKSGTQIHLADWYALTIHMRAVGNTVAIHSIIVILGHAQRGRVPAEVAPGVLHEP